jgi:YgiT-type zinc finger domain-containing protein
MAKRDDPCEYCDGTVGAERLVRVYRHRRGRHFIFEQVPARVCPRCGQRYFAGSVVRQMDRLMQARGTHRTVKVPVIRLRPTG